VLLYHHVGDVRPGTYPSLTVDPGRFRRHVEWFVRRGYRSLTIDDVQRWKCERRVPCGRRLLITFDDAYADIADFALPVLHAAGLSAVVFVPTAFIGGVNGWDADMSGTHAIMTAQQIRYWSKRGIDFGAHTRNHVDLTRLDISGARQEMAGSKADLEEIVGGPVTSFAYPYGCCDRQAVRIAASIFDVAFTTEPGPNSEGADPHQLKRSMVASRDTGPDVDLRARLGSSPRERTRAWIHALRQQVRPAR
jgi:peptidoglycan/xylan/chitin deacetylase (PgdA/CDA1 family)